MGLHFVGLPGWGCTLLGGEALAEFIQPCGVLFRIRVADFPLIVYANLHQHCCLRQEALLCKLVTQVPTCDSLAAAVAKLARQFQDLLVEADGLARVP